MFRNGPVARIRSEGLSWLSPGWNLYAPRPLVTAAALLLNGRTGYRSVRTKHAAIADLRLKQCFAVGAFVKILTSIRGHDLLLLMAAAWAG